MKRLAPRALDPITFQKNNLSLALSKSDFLLISFMRLLSCYLLARSFFTFFIVIELDFISFIHQTQTHTYFLIGAVSIVVLGLIASVGLWLLASWGIVLWIVLIIIDAYFYLNNIDLFLISSYLMIANVLLLTFYLILSYIQSIEE